MNADGTNKRWARSLPSWFGITEPSWSPDGSTLVVTVLFQYTPYLATMKVSTGEMAFVTLGGKTVQGRRPSYDPTGKKILYIGPAGRTIEAVHPESDTGYLYVSSDAGVDRPTYSPDGTKIAYSKPIAGTYNRDIFVYTLASGATKRLTTHAAIDWQPSWSPDGTKIAFSSTRSGQYQIWTMNAATGGNLTRITHTSTIEKDPAWSH
jgi:Tol biopolymer transport system component